MRFQIKIEDDIGTFNCTVDDICPTKMQDAIDILRVAFDKVIEVYRTKNHSTSP
jgi:hypothetical protein